MINLPYEAKRNLSNIVCKRCVTSRTCKMLAQINREGEFEKCSVIQSVYEEVKSLVELILAVENIDKDPYQKVIDDQHALISLGERLCSVCSGEKPLNEHHLCEECTDSWAHSGMSLNEFRRWAMRSEF